MTAMVGVRILLRASSIEKSPSFVEVFGRTQFINVSVGTGRWIDFPFTREESIIAGRNFKITCELAWWVCGCPVHPLRGLVTAYHDAIVTGLNS